MLPDLLQDRLDVVFCGTAAGTRSAALRQYYAGRGNKFWKVLHNIGLTPRALAPSEFNQLLESGIGLTDIVKDQSGMDRGIAFHQTAPDALRAKVGRFTPRFLCFNGKKAAKVYFGRDQIAYGLQQETIGATRVFVAPSSSGTAAASWEQAIWQNLADLVRGNEAAA